MLDHGQGPRRGEMRFIKRMHRGILAGFPFARSERYGADGDAGIPMTPEDGSYLLACGRRCFAEAGDVPGMRLRVHRPVQERRRGGRKEVDLVEVHPGANADLRHGSRRAELLAGEMQNIGRCRRAAGSIDEHALQADVGCKVSAQALQFAAARDRQIDRRFQSAAEATAESQAARKLRAPVGRQIEIDAKMRRSHRPQPLDSISRFEVGAGLHAEANCRHAPNTTVVLQPRARLSVLRSTFVPGAMATSPRGEP